MTAPDGAVRKGWRGLLIFAAVWAPISIVVGTAACHVSWGAPDRLHGQGFPIPSVIWDRPPGEERFVDYPYPAALILNPVACFLLGLFGWLLYRAVRAAVARLKGRTRA